jgi:hypothetical protein
MSQQAYAFLIDLSYRSFQSYTEAAVEPLNEESKQPRQPRGEPYEVVVSTLRRSNVNNTIHRALYALLAEEHTLISEAGQTLLFCIGPINTYDPNLGISSIPKMSEDGASAAFHLDRRIYLDAFMYRKRDGVRLGLITEDVKHKQRRIEELDKYRRSIITYQGEDSRELLRSSLKYLSTLHSDQPPNDQVRATGIAEAGPRLEAILAHLEQEITAVDAELEGLQTAIEQSQTSMMTSFEETLTHPEYQSMAYDLQAAVFDDNDGSYTYVRHRADFNEGDNEKWWRIQGSVAQEVSEDDVLQDRNNLSFVVYTAARDGDTEHPQEHNVAGGTNFTLQDTVHASTSIRYEEDRIWWSKQAIVVSMTWSAGRTPGEADEVVIDFSAGSD